MLALFCFLWIAHRLQANGLCNRAKFYQVKLFRYSAYIDKYFRSKLPEYLSKKTYLGNGMVTCVFSTSQVVESLAYR